MSEVSGRYQQNFSLTRVITLAIIVAIVAFGLGWAGAKHSDKSQNPATSNMLLYKSTAYGFQLDYPAGWSSPNITKYAADKGSRYTISFVAGQDAQEKRTASISMDTKDAVNKICDANGANCATTKPLTKESLQAILKNPSKDWLVHDSSSYSTLTTSKAQNITSLTIVKAVDLSKQNVSAASAAYWINGDVKNCPDGKLAPADSNSCITQDIYDQLLNVVSSLKSS